MTTVRTPAPPRLLLPRSRRSLGAAALSLLLHGGLVAFLVLAHWREILSWDNLLAPGASHENGQGGGGGGGIRVVALPALTRIRIPDPAPPPPVPPSASVVAPTPVPASPDPEPTPVTPPSPADSGSAAGAGEGGGGRGGGRGEGVGPGEGDGVGPGRGSGSGSGEGGDGGRALPPVPRQLILPPLDYPRSMRGRTVAVTFWVGVDGRVRRVALEPDIDDRGFARRFIEVMLNYRFRPARAADGAATPGTTTVSVSF